MDHITDLKDVAKRLFSALQGVYYVKDVFNMALSETEVFFHLRTLDMTR